MRVDQDELLSRLLESQSFDAAARIIFDHFDLLDDLFFVQITEFEPTYRNILYEAVMRAVGIVEDPEIVGANETRIISLICGNLSSDSSPEDAVISHEDVQRRLMLATDDALAEPATGIRLAVVHHAMSIAARAAGGLGPSQSPVFLCALGDITRARILGEVPYRTFDAVHYLRRGTKAMEGLWDDATAGDAATAEVTVIESELMSASIELIDMVERLARESRAPVDEP